MELEKMSDIELLHAYAGCNDMKLYQASEKELLKRLSKNNIEEFKKKLIEKLKENQAIYQVNSSDRKEIQEYNKGVWSAINMAITITENLINNVGKEK